MQPRPFRLHTWSLWLGLLLLGFGLEGRALPSEEKKPTPPNIIFILADDLGYGDLGCYGSKQIRTPHLDRLAGEGTRFTQCYAGAPVCAPSRGVLMTGLHTGHARIRQNFPAVGGVLEPYAEGKEGDKRISFRAEDHTVAEMLKNAGYATGLVGKWGLGESGSAGIPTRHGFDEFLGYLNQNHAAYYYTDYLDRNNGRYEIDANAGGRRQVYSNDLFAEFGNDFIRRHRDHPFFLYLAYTIPHNLMEVPELGEYAREDWPEEAKIYAAMITRLDGYVGRLLAELAALGLADNTIVFFSSDNGPVAGAKADLFDSSGGLRGAKSSVYEGGLRVPMIVRWPGQVPAGRVSETPWMFADFSPTCADLAGLPPPVGLDGASVLPLLRHVSQRPEARTFYWEFPTARLHQALRRANWKAVRFGTDQPVELYDLATDPGETRNLATEYPQVASELAQSLDRSHQPSPHWPAR